MTDGLLKEICKIVGEDSVKTQEIMAGHTTFRVGGPADYYLTPKNEEEAVALLRLFCDAKEPFFVLGRGSNLLVSDEGYRGSIIALDSSFSEITIDGTKIFAMAGAPLIKIAMEALNHGLSGLEFASGIPGTLGGGVTMNAGAYGGELKDVIESVRLFDKTTGEVLWVDASLMDFSYRHSIVSIGRYVVLAATLRLNEGDPVKIREAMEDFKGRRVSKQPLEYPSAGSTFKRPEGYFAGKLIEDAGLKGFSVGGAQVSEKHSGFVINKNNATANDIVTLIKEVQDKVYELNNVKLETEVCMLGFEE